MAPSLLKATGIGIKIPSSFLSLGINPPFLDQKSIYLLVPISHRRE
jgi:hypothetical protein